MNVATLPWQEAMPQPVICSRATTFAATRVPTKRLTLDNEALTLIATTIKKA